MNVISIVGNLGKDPESFTGKTTVVKFSVATTEYYNSEQQTTWHNCVCFGKTAEVAEKYLIKGSKVGITGRIEYPEWTAKDGTARQGNQIVVNNLEFLSARTEPMEKVEGKMTTPIDDPVEESPEDDLPF